MRRWFLTWLTLFLFIAINLIQSTFIMNTLLKKFVRVPIRTGSSLSFSSHKLLKGVTYVGLVLSVIPAKPVLCAEENKDKKDEAKLNTMKPKSDAPSFDDFLKKARNIGNDGSDPFQDIQKIISEQFGNEGALKSVRELFESGVPGQVTFNLFISGYIN
jgi:hypothetical protein